MQDVRDGWDDPRRFWSKRGGNMHDAQHTRCNLQAIVVVLVKGTHMASIAIQLQKIFQQLQARCGTSPSRWALKGDPVHGLLP